MADLWYGHFDSTPDDPRILLAADWAKFIASFITNGIRNGGTNLQVTADTGMTVNVDNGTACILGYIMQLNTDLNGRYYSVLVPPANPQYPRIDRLILRLDRRIAVRNIRPMILMGTAASSPAAPTLTRSNDIWELSLAQIRVNANATAITAGNITDERFNTELCGIMNSVLGLDPSTWQAQFEEFLTNIGVANQDSIDYWTNINKENMDFWTNKLETDFNLWLEDFVTQSSKDFITWFNTIKGLLGNDPATQLAAELNATNTRVTSIEQTLTGGDLAREATSQKILNYVAQPMDTSALAKEATSQEILNYSRRSIIKSIQRGIINMPGDTTYNVSVTISPVDVQKSTLSYLGFSGSMAAAGTQHGAYLKLASDSVTASTYPQSIVKSGIVSWEVVEYY